MNLQDNKPFLIAYARLVEPGADEDAVGAEEDSWLLEDDLGRAFLMFTGLDTGDTSGVDVPKDRRISFISFLVQSVLPKPQMLIGKIMTIKFSIHFDNFPINLGIHHMKYK